MGVEERRSTPSMLWDGVSDFVPSMRRDDALESEGEGRYPLVRRL